MPFPHTETGLPLMQQTAATSALPSPRTIAVAGASALEGGNYYGARVLINLVEAGVKAEIYPINPRLAGSELCGLPVYGSLSDLPTAPDMVFVVWIFAGLLSLAGAFGLRRYPRNRA